MGGRQRRVPSSERKREKRGGEKEMKETIDFGRGMEGGEREVKVCRSKGRQETLAVMQFSKMNRIFQETKTSISVQLYCEKYNYVI